MNLYSKLMSFVGFFLDFYRYYLVLTYYIEAYKQKQTSEGSTATICMSHLQDLIHHSNMEFA